MLQWLPPGHCFEDREVEEGGVSDDILRIGFFIVVEACRAPPSAGEGRVARKVTFRLSTTVPCLGSKVQQALCCRG